MQIESRGVKHTLYRYSDVKATGLACPAEAAPKLFEEISTATPSYNHTQADVTADKTAKDDKNKVKVSGEVTLPPAK